MTFVRERGRSRVVAVLNLSPWTIHADFRTGGYAGEYLDAMTCERIVLPEHFECDILPWHYRILVKP